MNDNKNRWTNTGKFENQGKTQRKQLKCSEIDTYRCKTNENVEQWLKAPPDQEKNTINSALFLKPVWHIMLYIISNHMLGYVIVLYLGGTPSVAQTDGRLDFWAAKVVSVPTGLLASGFTQVAHGQTGEGMRRDWWHLTRSDGLRFLEVFDV